MLIRGKKRGHLAYKGTYAEDDGYLIEEDKRWTLPQTVIPARVPEDEVQEVTIEMTEEKGKPLGITQGYNSMITIITEMVICKATVEAD